MIKNIDSQSNDDEETDDFDVTSSNVSLDENTSRLFDSKVTSTPSSEHQSNRFHRDATTSKRRNNKANNSQITHQHNEIRDNEKIFLCNAFLSQIENLENVLWNYKLQSSLFSEHQRLSLPSEIIFKILL